MKPPTCGDTDKICDRILYICEVCSKGFKTKKEFIVHERVHTNERPFKCQECQKAFKQRGALRDHMVTHSGVRRHTCQVCDGRFSTSSSLRRHITKVHDRHKSFSCCLCSEIFLNKSSYTDHKEVHFGNILNGSVSEVYRLAKQPNGYKCFRCGKILKKKASLFIHLDVHSGTLYRCQHCGENFTFLALKTHISRHHKQQRCPLCSEHFTDRKKYNLHLNAHFRVNSDTCNYCGEAFDIDLLAKHMKAAHIPLGDCYHCKTCTKVFSHAEHLRKHLTFAHIKCKECGKFFDHIALSKHYMEKHLNNSKFKCEYCRATFKNKTRLAFHLNEVHLMIGKFPCRICGEKFSRYKNLHQHKQKFGHIITVRIKPKGKRKNKRVDALRKELGVDNALRKLNCKVCEVLNGVLMSFVGEASLVEHLLTVHLQPPQAPEDTNMDSKSAVVKSLHSIVDGSNNNIPASVSCQLKSDLCSKGFLFLKSSPLQRDGRLCNTLITMNPPPLTVIGNVPGSLALLQNSNYETNDDLISPKLHPQDGVIGNPLVLANDFVPPVASPKQYTEVFSKNILSPNNPNSSVAPVFLKVPENESSLPPKAEGAYGDAKSVTKSTTFKEPYMQKIDKASTSQTLTISRSPEDAERPSTPPRRSPLKDITNVPPECPLSPKYVKLESDENCMSSSHVLVENVDSLETPTPLCSKSSLTDTIESCTSGFTSSDALNKSSFSSPSKSAESVHCTSADSLLPFDTSKNLTSSFSSALKPVQSVHCALANSSIPSDASKNFTSSFSSPPKPPKSANCVLTNSSPPSDASNNLRSLFSSPAKLVESVFVDASPPSDASKNLQSLISSPSKSVKSVHSSLAGSSPYTLQMNFGHFSDTLVPFGDPNNTQNIPPVSSSLKGCSNSLFADPNYSVFESSSCVKPLKKVDQSFFGFLDFISQENLRQCNGKLILTSSVEIASSNSLPLRDITNTPHCTSLSKNVDALEKSLSSVLPLKQMKVFDNSLAASCASQSNTGQPGNTLVLPFEDFLLGNVKSISSESASVTNVCRLIPSGPTSVEDISSEISPLRDLSKLIPYVPASLESISPTFSSPGDIPSAPPLSRNISPEFFLSGDNSKLPSSEHLLSESIAPPKSSPLENIPNNSSTDVKFLSPKDPNPLEDLMSPVKQTEESNGSSIVSSNSALRISIEQSSKAVALESRNTEDAAPTSLLIEDTKIPNYSIARTSKASEENKDTVVNSISMKINNTLNDCMMANKEMEAFKSSLVRLTKALNNNLFYKKSSISKSMATNSPDNTYKCPLCMKKYIICSNLAQHIVKQHCYETQCQLCQQNFKDRRNLYRHKTAIHSEYTCIKCLEVFSSKADLVEHKNKHYRMAKEELLLKNYTCEVCTRTFATSSSLKRHTKKHKAVSNGGSVESVKI